ncbi:MAG: HAD-IA family hydrolase [Caldilineaceae bacterium]|nr:HAD-IA family hydrolase [Caldilineaceae bacterium]
MPYKLIMFDFDGTLADSFALFLRIIDQLADTYQFKRLGEAERALLRKAGATALYQQMALPLWKFWLVRRAFQRLMAEQIDQVKLFAGVEQLLPQLTAQGVPIAIVSSNTYTNVQRVLGPHNAAYITYWECDAPAFGKAIKFRRILRKSKIPAKEAIYIGDELRDQDATRKAGIAFGAVAWGYTELTTLAAHSPAESFHTLEELGQRFTRNR